MIDTLFTWTGLIIIVSLFATGLVSGFMAGLIGIGGGAVTVPVLTEFFLYLDVPETAAYQLAVGSSLGIIIPTSLRSFSKHRARGAVDEALLKSWILPILVGVIFGTLMSKYAPAQILQWIFAIIIFIIALHITFSRDSWLLGKTMPGAPSRQMIGGGIGFFSSIMGIGGGIFGNSIMTLFGQPIHRAVATSSGIGVLISIPAFFGALYAGWQVQEGMPPLTLGYVNFAAIALIIPASVAAAPLGVKVAHLLPAPWLKRAFALFLFFVALRFVWRLVF